jgi:ribonuclease H2 subunit A
MQSGSGGGGGGNLNAQAVAATMALVRGALDRGVRVASLVVDALGPPAAHAARLRAAFPEIGSVVVENKADSIYAVVGAASVVAKVSRDEALEVMWRARNEGGEGEGMGWGSGYPSDGRCTGWMRREMDPVFGWGSECRFSWGTARDMLEGKKARVKVEWEEPDGEDGSMKMTRFFVGQGEEVDDELVGWWGRRVGPEVF